MRYTDFFDEFVRYLYRDSIGGSQFVLFEELAGKNEIPYEPGYLATIQRELKAKGFLIGPDPVGGDGAARGMLTGDGLRYVESIHKDDAPQGLSDWRDLGKDFTEVSEVVVIPASDRRVSLDHNAPEYLRVTQGLEELYEAARSINSLPDQDRILKGLIAAQSLWQAAELKVIQIKIGVMMAIEDASQALSGTAKAVGAALLIDAIKSLVKSSTGVDLDQI